MTSPNERKQIGIDGSRYPSEIRTGTETYTRELLDALSQITVLPFSVRTYLNRTDAQSSNNLARLGDVRPMPFPRFWTHARLSVEMLRHRPDLLFVPAHVIPVIHPRTVVTIHDLGYLHEPGAHPLRQRRMLDLATRWNARTAAHVIAISETTRQDLIRYYGTPADKITVIHHGVSDCMTPAAESRQRQIRAKYHLPDRFVLAVGTIQPRKNLARLAAAVSELRKEDPKLSLVVAGKRGWMADSVIAEIGQLLPTTTFRELGYVASADLPALYSSASVTAMISSYEGFGLPVLEALRSGSPLVISDTPALTEVAGEAALVAQADSTSMIARQLANIMENPELGAQLRARGFTRAANFTWQTTARKTAELLDFVSRA